MDLEGLGFLIGLIGAGWMKSAMNLVQDCRPRPELQTLGQEPRKPGNKSVRARPGAHCRRPRA
jgi:hypothetical protein